MNEKVCTVVVTYNRKNLLLECLQALKNQTRPLDAIYLIDNASTDNTPKFLKENGYITKLPPKNINDNWEETFFITLSNERKIPLHYVRMKNNTGGAGGFYEGLKRAFEKGYDWFWLMDDDTIPGTLALDKLLKKKEELKDLNIGFLCSKVVWIDKNPHIMNIPAIKPVVNGTPFNLFEDKNVLVVESASFVSLLLNRKTVEKIGLPIKEFFIWADDVEYTLRITKNNFLGLYVKDSIVIHKTKTNYSPNGIYDWRFYYNVRNWLWIYKLHYKKKYIFELIKNILLTPRLPFKVWHTNLKASIDSLIKTPKIEGKTK